MMFSGFTKAVAAAVLLGGSVTGTILWDGRFNDLASSMDLNNWSWSNEVGPYQYYIHGPSAVTSYVNLSPSYKNPADTSSKQGVKITLDSTSYWNGQTMRRTELIPQTATPSKIVTGLVYYHFSIMRSATNAPSIYREHQIAFFESHFTELKAGWISGEAGTSDNLLRWDVQGVTKWSVVWEAGTWHNFVYAIDFSANTVALYHSTASSPLTLTIPAISVSTSSNGADFHLGVLELPVTGQPDIVEDYFFSGVYIESGTLSTSVSGPGGSAPPVSSSSSSARRTTTLATVKSSMSSTTTLKGSSTTRSSAKPTTSTSPATPTPTGGDGSGSLPKWSQCGGIGWSGSGTCVAGTACTYSNPYYSQCL